MELDKKDLERGKKFIVGKWQVDYLVNFFSSDLAHIPASEFKSSEGRDFSVISFEFYADNTLKVDLADDRSEVGSWQQTDMFEFEWHFDSLSDAVDSQFLKGIQKLTVYDGDLTFAISFLTLALKKVVV